MKYGSLFTGIGGFDLALNRAGFTCAWQAETDKAASSVLSRQFPGVQNYGDVRNIGRGVEPVDLICGGFPCQDLSIAGKRAGLDGERSGLWFEFARIVGELKPEWVVIENVPGLLSSNGGRDMETVIRALVECGYGVAWRVLDAQYFGLAQRRKRVFIVGSLGNGRAAEVLFEREGGAGDTPPSRETGEGVAVATLRGFGHGWQGQHNDTNAVIANWQSGGGRMDDDKAASLRSGAEHSAQFVWQNRQQSGEVRVQDDSLPTMSKYWGTGGNNVPFVGVRRLTPTECERLQGFPDGWTAGQSDSARYRQLGNAVAVPVVGWIARRIIKVAISVINANMKITIDFSRDRI